MYTEVTRRFTFEAAHTIPKHPGKCKFPHGHSYKLFVTVGGYLEPRDGYFIDFGDIRDMVDVNVIQELDHKNLNEIIKPVASAENIAWWIWDALLIACRVIKYEVALKRIRLYETENCYVDVTGR